MSLRIFVEDSFDSAHSLPHLPATHKCHSLHGHTYRLRMEFSGPIGRDGWIVDYGVVKGYWGLVKQRIDHKFLNELITPSTCENLAAWIAKELAKTLKKFGPPLVQLERIELRETERCGAVWSRQ